MHSECGHSVHSHLNNESLVTYLPTDSPKTFHKKNREKFTEAVITNRLKRYIDKYNCFIEALGYEIESYACHMHSDFQILRNSEIKIELQVQAFKTGATCDDTLTYYWPEGLTDLVWKRAQMLAHVCRTVLCPKCKKSAFEHTASHFTDRIKPHLYHWADRWAKKGFCRKPRH